MNMIKPGQAVLLSTAYLPPVEYFIHILAAREVYVEYCENFAKQTYRNRAIISTASGRFPLIIPVVHSGNKIPIGAVRIDEKSNWRRLHWRTIEAAYNTSPYFIYYKDELKDILNDGPSLLFDLNLALMRWAMKQSGIRSELLRTKEYTTETQDMEDLRNFIHPKRKQADNAMELSPYQQVFGDYHGFIPNLSIIDLLFNLGPESHIYLSRSIKML